MKMKAYIKRALLTFLALAFCHGTFADDLEYELPVTAVKVHPASAVVTRSDLLDLPAGEHRLVISNIPAIINRDRLAVMVPSPAVRIGSIDIAETDTGALVSPLEQRLQTELEILRDERVVITDAIETANSELKLISSLTSGGSEAGIGAQELQDLLGVIGSSSEQARARVRQARISLRDKDEEIRAKEFEMQQVQTRRVRTSSVTVQLDVASAVSVPVTVSYPENNARWYWVYEARLDTEASQMNFFRQAVVIQNSGEDWKSIDLTLTTANLNRNITTPALSSIFLDLLPEAGFKATDDVVVTGTRARTDGMGSPSPVEVVTLEEIQLPDPARVIDGLADLPRFRGAYTQAAATVASQYLVEFDIPGKITVTANQQDKLVAIDQNAFDVDLVSRTVPDRDTAAYLEARFTFEQDIPFQAAEVHKYRDGAYIGSAATSPLLPDQDVRMPFGVDELVRVEVRQEQAESRSPGVLRRSNFDDFRRRYEVTSFHNEPVMVEVIGNVPVSEHADIVVDIPDEATPASEAGLDGRAGLLMWEFEIAPGETETVRHYYSVSYPKDERLSYKPGN